MFRIVESQAEDRGRGVARVCAADLDRYGLKEGDIVELEGQRRSALRMRSGDAIAQGTIALDPVALENLGRSPGQTVRMYRTVHSYAQSVTLIPLIPLVETDMDRDRVREHLKGVPITTDDVVQVAVPSGKSCPFKVMATLPAGAVLISPSTVVTIEKPKLRDMARGKVTYQDIGGLAPQLRKVREMIELPLRFPEVFLRFGVEPPKGVLLYGPPGTGKTVIARAVANETEAWFTSISGPEVIGKYYGESEERLRALFEEAQANAPAIVFIDEVDAIAPKREDMGGEKQVERRVVSQLLTLMDGLSSRGQVVVIAATNIPNSLDPALRRPGRFDREIAIPIPDRNGRLEILKIHSRGMPLADDVDMERLADVTHGFVGADLQALAKESAMMALRRLMPSLELSKDSLPDQSLLSSEVTMQDFTAALREIEASAIREVFVEVPDTTWNQVGGLDTVKEELIEAVQWPLSQQSLFQRYGVTPPKGILIHGPSGTGKTLLVKALAHESGVNFISVKGPSLMSRYVGESERALRDVFRTARQAAPSILYFDEIDSLLPLRGQDSGPQAQTTERVISQFLTEMSGIEAMEGVVVVGTTNRLDRMDPALFSAGRFELLLGLPLPDQEAREAIFRIHLERMPLSPQVDLAQLAHQTQGRTGAEVAQICRSASMAALREHIKSGRSQEPLLELRHFQRALAETAARDSAIGGHRGPTENPSKSHR